MCVCVRIAVRSRSLLFFDEGSPLEESLAASEGERQQSEGHTHIQMSRYTADAHSNRTAGAESDRRYENRRRNDTFTLFHSVTLTCCCLPSGNQRQTEPLRFSDAASTCDSSPLTPSEHLGLKSPEPSRIFGVISVRHHRPFSVSSRRCSRPSSPPNFLVFNSPLRLKGLIFKKELEFTFLHVKMQLIYSNII